MGCDRQTFGGDPFLWWTCGGGGGGGGGRGGGWGCRWLPSQWLPVRGEQQPTPDFKDLTLIQNLRKTKFNPFQFRALRGFLKNAYLIKTEELKQFGQKSQ